MVRVRSVVVLVLLLAGCGYGVVTPYRARGGVEKIHVRAFENDSVEPGLGAVVTAALRSELARRGAEAGADAPAQLDGVVRVTAGPSSTYFTSAATVSVEVHAKLSLQGQPVHEVTVHRTEGHQGGGDALESEGRRATALVKMARDAAREVLRALEEQTPPTGSGTDAAR
jgi:hypothetical protein